MSGMFDENWVIWRIGSGFRELDNIGGSMLPGILFTTTLCFSDRFLRFIAWESHILFFLYPHVLGTLHFSCVRFALLTDFGAGARCCTGFSCFSSFSTTITYTFTKLLRFFFFVCSCLPRCRELKFSFQEVFCQFALFDLVPLC